MTQTISQDMPLKILNRVFGYHEFRPLQEEVIKNILDKRDTLLIMPTGGGKSLCYQIPALIFQGLTIVVSPLVSLMRDQVEQLKELNINTVVLNSTITPDQYRSNVAQIKNKKAKLLYISPESLLKNNILEMLSSIQVDCLAIDEAHCISEWGHNFRPEYRQLSEVRTRFPECVCFALTATATPRVRTDIVKNLKLNDPAISIGSFNRKNLFVQVSRKENPSAQTLRFIERFNGQSGIIYCFSRQQVDDLYKILEAHGYSVRPYHAGLSTAERDLNQRLFTLDDVQIIVATIAFGMGINKPNVRFVVHYDLPKNIESYYQEIGRAGRDGLLSHCLLLFSYGDIRKIKYFINEKDENQKRIAGIHLDALIKFVESTECRRTVLLNYFGEEYSTDNCGLCDICVSEERPKTDITIPAQKFLSCVKRTNEIFGASHIINVLRGSKEKKILQFGHQHLSTYGIGMEHTKKQWVQLSRQFLHQGLVIQDMEYGGLRLSEKGWDVLKGSCSVSGFMEPDKINSEQESDLAPGSDYDRDLFAILKKKRKKLADDTGVPPYVIFPDRTLVEMSVYFPHSMESLLEIHGIGEAKLGKYGQIFLKEIRDYSRDHQIEIKKIDMQKTEGLRSLQKEPGRQSRTKRRFEVIGELFNNGHQIPDIMKKFGIKESTVIDNLFRFAQEGNMLEPEDITIQSKLSPEMQAAVVRAFKDHGTELLRAVHDALDKRVDYEELKIMRLYYLCK